MDKIDKHSQPKTKNFVVHNVPPDLRFKLIASKAKIKADTWLDFLIKVTCYIEKRSYDFLQEENC